LFSFSAFLFLYNLITLILYFYFFHRFEEVPPGTLPEGGKPIVDGRSWT